MSAAYGAVEMLKAAWRADWFAILMAALMVLGSGFAPPLLAVMFRMATEAVLAGNVAGAAWAAAGVAAAAMASLMLFHFAFVPFAEATEKASIALDRRIMSLASGSDTLGRHETPQYADNLVIAQREVSSASLGLLGLMTGLSLSVSLFCATVLLMDVYPALALLPLAALPSIFLSQRAELILDTASQASASELRVARHMFELATDEGSSKELRVLHLSQEVRDRHELSLANVDKKMRRAEGLSVLLNICGNAFFAAAYMGAVVVVLIDVVRGDGTVGDAVLVITLSAIINQQVTASLEQFRRLQKMASGFARLRWLEQMSSRPVAKALKSTPQRVSDGLVLDRVSFGYHGREDKSLEEVSLHLPAGSLIAVVGESGSGKSTLIKLLCRLYEPTSGHISCDGVDLRQYDDSNWKNGVAACFQDFMRFEATVQQSVGIGDLAHLNDGACVRLALARAGAEAFVNDLPEALHCHLGRSYRDGVDLSGGQWQKLAFARGLMRDLPRLVVLDEPTSALDAVAEHLLFESYAREARRMGERNGTITVLVTHRYSTVRMADFIVFLRDGRVAEKGTHRELMLAGGDYAHLYEAQAASYRGEG